MGIADLSRKSHRADGRRRRFQRIVGIRHDKRGHHPGQLAARAGDPAHLRSSVADHKASLRVCYKVDRACNGDDGAGLLGKILDKPDGISQVLFCHCIGNVCIHALRRAASKGQRLNLRDIAADDREADPLHQICRCPGAQCACAGADRIEQRHMAQFLRLCGCQFHALDAPFVERSDVDIETAADRCDVLHIPRLIGHDGASAAGKKNVGHVVDRHVIGDVVYKR